MSHTASAPPAGDERATGMPGWARALDERGKRVWRRPTGEAGERARWPGYVVSIVVNAILIVIARTIPSWGLPFITPAFADALPAIERSLVVGMLANAILCAYDATWFRHLAQVTMNAFALNATLALYRIFPFDFGTPSGDDLARLVLLLIVVALIIAIFVEMVLALVDRLRDATE